MTDVWDFSSLLDSWSRAQTPAGQQLESFAEISEQMQKELDEISSQIALLDTDDPATLSSLQLLTPPPQTVPVVEPSTPPPEPVTVKKEKASTPSRLPPLTKTNKSFATPKPTRVKEIVQPRAKELIQTRAKKTYRARYVPPPGAPVFKATPDKLSVVNFSLSTPYVMKFTLQNLTTKSRGFQVRGPKDPAFSFRVVEDVDTSLIRPGLHLTFEVTFFPTEPRDYEGSILILAGDGDPPTAVSLYCYRDPPQLVMPDIVDLGATLVHSVKEGSFTVTNQGGIAFFSFFSVTGREDSLIFTDGAFSLTPSQFQLDRGQSVDINIRFKPGSEGDHSASLEIRAQHFPQKFFCMAKGYAAVPKMRFAICNEDRLLLPFLPADANTTRQIEIVNEADVAYMFHVQLVRPKEATRAELVLLYPETDTTSVKGRTPFSVSPASGLLGAKGSVTLNITFSPKMFAFYRENIVIFADRIPDEVGTKGTRKMLTIAAEGTTGPPSVSIQPPLVLFNEVVPKTPTKQAIDVVNESYLNVKLQWRKSDVISPSPVVFDVKPKERTEVELCFLVNKKIPVMQTQGSEIFKNLPHIGENRALIPSAKDIPRPPSSQNYTISFSPLSKSTGGELIDQKIPEEVGEEENVDVDEMPNIFGLRQWSSYVDTNRENKLTMLGPNDLDIRDNVGHVKEEISLQADSFTQMTFTYSANIAPPSIIAEPPVLDFGCVLTGETGTKVLTLVNPFSNPIGFCISIAPGPGEWSLGITQVVIEEESKVEIPVSIKFDSHTAVSSMLTVHAFWATPEGTAMEQLPVYSCDIPVYAVFDNPIVKIQDRVIDIGEVFPTLVYNASMKMTLLNSFPTHFNIDDFGKTEKTEEEEEPLPESAIEYTKSTPPTGYLLQGETTEVNIEARFSELGHRALPFSCNVIGGKYTCALVAHVIPPKLKLVTESVDFSSDFVICNRSHSAVVVTNDCGVDSTVCVEMVDDCNGVFSLDDTSTKTVSDRVEIAVSCYSEIHGDYYGKLKLIIEDPWQQKEIIIPMHVKALGSFFGFQKHTLGYTQGVDSDFVSFGANIEKSDKKVIRRITLQNFSAEAITVDWMLENLVEGRNYADIDFDIQVDGSVNISITETPEASLQDPYSLGTQRTIVPSHDKTVVVVEFVPREVGTFRGLLTARSGEFSHTLGLFANVI